MTNNDKARESVRDYRSIREDYAFDPSIFNTEPERVARVKWIIANRLTEVDRTLILLYADCQSYRKLAKRLGISYFPVQREIRRIKAAILAEYDKLTNPK